MKYVAVTRHVAGFRQPLAEGQIAELCRRAFGPGAIPRACVLLDSGKFNTSYRIQLPDGHPVILRVAPSRQAALFSHEKMLLRRESAVQRVLNTVSDLFPRNLFEDFTGELCDRDYVFQNCLPGFLWDDVKSELSPAENESLWSQMAPIVKQVHDLVGERFGFPAPMEQCGSNSEAVIQWIAGMIEDLQRRQLRCDDAAILLRLAESGRHHLDAVARPHLVHGDLWQKNILISRIDDAPVITAVLDAERAFWGDPEAEWIFTFLDLPAVFWQNYGKLETDHGAVFRRLIYTGRGAMQLFLEAWRFQFDDSPFRRVMQHAIQELRSSRFSTTD